MLDNGLPPDGPAAWEKLLAIGCGISFVVAMLILAVAVPNPTPFQYTIFRTVIAIAIAGVAASIPGFLHLEIGSWLKAGGAMAVFAIVYFYNPASLVAPTNKPLVPPGRQFTVLVSNGNGETVEADIYYAGFLGTKKTSADTLAGHFNGISPVSIDTLPKGNYGFWARDGSNHESAIVQDKVPDVGRDSKLIPLVIK